MEVTTSYLQGKYGVEIRIMSVNKDNSHSWVRISHGLNKLVTDLNNNEQETSEIQFEEHALRLNAGDFASRSKAKAKPPRRTSASSSIKTIPIVERTWTDVEPGKQSLSDYSVSKKLINLLLHGSLPRDDDGAIDFWRLKDYLRNEFVHSQHWSDEMWKSTMAKGGGNKKICQYYSDSSGTILYLRALQGHSGRNLIDPSLQDNVVIQNGFFHHIYHIGCAFDLHSIIDNGLILGGQNSSKRQTVFFLPIDPRDKEHKGPEKIDLNVLRRAQYMHKAWKKHQNTVYWVDINLAQQKGFKFYQTRSNDIILHETLPAYCIPKVVLMETGDVIYEQVYASPRPPPKTSLKHDWMKELGSAVARQAEGEVARQAKSSQSTQPNPNPHHERTGKNVVCPQRGAPRSQEIETRSFREEAVRHDRTGKPVVCCDENHERPTVVCSEQASHPRFSREGQNLILEEDILITIERRDPLFALKKERTKHVSLVTARASVWKTKQITIERGKLVVCHDVNHERSILNKVDIDFRIPGLPHSAVKQADNYRVGELVKKIENHPDRHALQLDLQQNKSFKPFSEKSKKMI